MERVNETAIEVLMDEYLDCVAGGSSDLHLEDISMAAKAPSRIEFTDIIVSN